MILKNPRKPQESKVMKIVNVAGTMVMLNLMFLLACIPVVTIGPALCGLYSGVRYIIRGDGPVRGFWQGFKTHFVRMMIAGVIFTAILAYLVIVVNSAYNTWLEVGVFRDVVIHSIPPVAVLMLLCALVPLNIYIPYNVADWLKNGVNLLFKAPHWLLLSACMVAVPVACLFWVSDLLVLAIVTAVGFWFAASAFVSTLVLKDDLLEMLLEYREEHPEEEEEEEEPSEED